VHEDLATMAISNCEALVVIAHGLLYNFFLVHEDLATMAISYCEALVVIAHGLFSSVLEMC